MATETWTLCTNNERVSLVKVLSIRPRAADAPRPLLALTALVVAACLLLGTSAQSASAQSASASASAQGGYSPGTTYALNTSGEILGFDRGDPSRIDSRVGVSGLAAGEALVGVDFRPATGELYGIGTANQVYTIDPATGVASLVAPLTEELNGNVFGVDFNPSADAIRIVSDTAQNLRVDPDTGETTVDTALAYAPGDPNAGVAPAVVAGAYANNFPDVAETALYEFDLATGNYVQQDPPDDGVLNTIAPVSSGFASLVGFDITSLGGFDEGFAAIQTAEDQPSVLYGVDVESGAVGAIGGVGQGEYVLDIAIPTTGMDGLPETGGLPLGALAAATLLGGLALFGTGLSVGAIGRRSA